MLEALSRFTQILEEVTLDLVGDGVPVERRTVKWNVRSPLKSRHIEGRYRCQLSAISRHSANTVARGLSTEFWALTYGVRYPSTAHNAAK